MSRPPGARIRCWRRGCFCWVSGRAGHIIPRNRDWRSGSHIRVRFVSSNIRRNRYLVRRNGRTSVAFIVGVGFVATPRCVTISIFIANAIRKCSRRGLSHASLRCRTLYRLHFAIVQSSVPLCAWMVCGRLSLHLLYVDYVGVIHELVAAWVLLSACGSKLVHCLVNPPQPCQVACDELAQARVTADDAQPICEHHVHLPSYMPCACFNGTCELNLQFTNSVPSMNPPQRLA